MDDSAAHENTDDSSIKPVSSLRSHFEKMAGPKPSSSATSRDGSPVGRPKERSEDSYLRMDGRTSLDLPAREKVWIPQRGRSVVEESSQGGLRPPVAPTARHRSPGAPSRQRPISMGPLSPPRTPPVVKVESPRSPPKPLNFSVPRNPTPRPLGNGSTTPFDFNPQGFNNFPGRQFKIPSRPNSPKPDFSMPSGTDPVKLPPPGPRTGLPTSERLSIDQARPRSFYGNQPEKPYPNERSYSPKRFPGGPPPINRPEKPKIPSKHSSIMTKGEGMNLGPTSSSDARVSPFSTPPGSDEDPSEGESSDVRRGCSGNSSAAGSSRSLRRSFDPPPANRPTTEPRSSQRERPTLRPGTSVTASKQSAGVQRVSAADDDLEENRPNLPPRREISTMEKHVITRAMAPSSQTPRDLSISTPSPIIESINYNFPPPPKRAGATIVSTTATTRDTRSQTSNRAYSSTSSLSTAVSTEKLDGHRIYIDEADAIIPGGPDAPRASLSDYPDSSQANRRMPCFKNEPREIQVKYDTRLFDVCGQYLCATGHFTRVWNLLTGELLVNFPHGEGVKVTSLAFKPAENIQEEGSQIWLGTNHGEIQELDIPSERVIYTKTSAHPRREVIRILRHANEMWTLDDEGKLHVWPADDSGSPNLRNTHYGFRVPKGHACSFVVDQQLWIASGKDIRVFQPSSDPSVPFNILARPMSQPNLGDVTSGAIVSSQPDRVFFGHADGKVSIYSRDDYSCLNVVNVSLYKINSLSGVGEYLWAAFNTGMIYVYDTSFKPWKVKKDWHAHDNPVIDILVDRSSILKIDRLQVLSLGTENAIKIWDGMLREDWIEAEMQDHDVDFCEFRELDALVLTWNAGASKPQDLLNDRRDSDFIRNLLQINEPYASDIIVFGLQELVDLEDGAVTAKIFFKSSKKKESSDVEHMSRQYREWRDYLTRCIEKYSPNEERYYLLHSASLVGLFTCVFVKSTLRGRARNVSTAEVKRGLGGLHGNKGALVVRFLIDDSSICFVNCHLAAGQTQTVHRNNDIAGILESAALPAERDAEVRSAIYVGGGDGTMILDHEICILNGDLNYRIDTMGRDTVINAVRSNDLAKLLDRDQLLLSRRKNPGFRLRAFEECLITFPPTYKYDVGTDNYDSSDKRRAPAWCDRILYRGIGKIKQLDYRRHEVHASDHRPVSGSFKVRVKTIIPEKRTKAWERSERKFEAVKQKTAAEAVLDFLINVCGYNINDARRMLREQEVSRSSPLQGK